MLSGVPFELAFALAGCACVRDGVRANCIDAGPDTLRRLYPRICHPGPPCSAGCEVELSYPQDFILMMASLPNKSHVPLGG